MTPGRWIAFHFLASDLLGISAGFALFSLLAFFPGYAIGWLTNVFGFRARLLPFRLAASVPLSLAAGPILGYTVGRWLGFNAVWIALAVLCAAALSSGALGRKARPLAGFDLRSLWPFAALIALWMAVAFLSLADLPIGRRLYFSIIDFDYSLRIAFTHSIGAFGLPARNPFFFPGHPVGLRYHYFWMIPCAMIYRLGSPLVDARQAFIAGTLWAGIGLISLIPLYLRLFGRASADLLRRSRLGIALLAITGLDIVPALMMVQLYRAGLISGISPSVEWWNEQIDGWMYTMLWEPHYTCSLIACLTGFLIVWSLPPQASRLQRTVSGCIAGMAFATAAGCGIYVAMVFALFLGLWLAVCLARGKWRETEALAISGAAAVALAGPFLAGLRDSFSHGPAPHLFVFHVRPFVPVELLLRYYGLARPWQLQAGDFLCLPLNYFVELGVFFVAGWMVWTRFREQKRAATSAELAGFLMLATSVLICTFGRSSIIPNNDLAWRGFLPAQFVLLLCAADVLPERASRSRLVRLTLVLGLAGVIYDLAILRFYPVLSDAGKVPRIAWLADDRLLGLRTAATRQAYEWLRARTPETAVIQQNPEPYYQDTFYGAYGHRQTAVLGAGCTSVFGGDPRECAPLMPVASGLFAGGGTPVLNSACRSLPIDFVVARDTDAAWRDRASWVWSGHPVFRNDFVRLFACHGQ
ncbi:MAG TPA: hypothetical protein VKF41_01930 [Bryobacteraceae bacterium]|nr:hypothetical protein [Bryobacteraceae bacterium]